MTVKGAFSGAVLEELVITALQMAWKNHPDFVCELTNLLYSLLQELCISLACISNAFELVGRSCDFGIQPSI